MWLKAPVEEIDKDGGKRLTAASEASWAPRKAG
jgi:hypothetical protein